MESLPNATLLVLLFILRLGVPLLITGAIAYGLKRLDAKWQAEAENGTQAEPAAEPTAQPTGAASESSF
ncbi:MAG TPA: hypothetical protein PKM78_07850 [Anaerolineae bacterium]|nr:hypothetical protein [Anaerolineae bacterium]HNU03822.1 hypothetical protein [Anaerolineae bacterium]